MPHFHHKNVCAEHGTVVAQCRCPGPKTAREVPCPGPQRCPGAKEPMPNDLPPAASGMHPACDLCRGACCEVLPVPINGAAMTNDDRRHLRMRGLVLTNEVILNCSCSELKGDGTCGIYSSRPQVCRDFKVGGEDCRKAVQLRRKDQERAIRRLLEGERS